MSVLLLLLKIANIDLRNYIDGKNRERKLITTKLRMQHQYIIDEKFIILM